MQVNTIIMMIISLLLLIPLLCVAHWLPAPLSFFFFNMSLKNVSLWCEAAGRKGEVNPSLIHRCTVQDQGCDDCVISSQHLGLPQFQPGKIAGRKCRLSGVSADARGKVLLIAAIELPTACALCKAASHHFHWICLKYSLHPHCRPSFLSTKLTLNSKIDSVFFSYSRLCISLGNSVLTKCCLTMQMKRLCISHCQ